MTVDVSQGGARLETSQVYSIGDKVHIRIPWSESTKAREMTGRVLRIQALEEAPGRAAVTPAETAAKATLSRVAVQWFGRS